VELAGDFGGRPAREDAINDRLAAVDGQPRTRMCHESLSIDVVSEHLHTLEWALALSTT
jgi:hypothetical protein